MIALCIVGSIKKELQKRKPLKIHSGTNPKSIIWAVENDNNLLLDYTPPESFIKKVRGLFIFLSRNYLEENLKAWKL